MWDQRASYVKICSVEELVQPFIILQWPGPCFEIPDDDRKEVFVSRVKNVLCAFEMTTTRNCENLFNLEQGFPRNAIFALRAFSKNYVEDICISVL